MSSTLMPNYARLPVTFVKGEGAWLWDIQGTRYLDALAGLAVCGLGHAHAAVTAAICEQAHLLLHTSNLYSIAHQQALADEMTRISGMDTVFFCNSGAEANEAAIKIARLYGNQRHVEVPTIIVMEGAFHGRTLATLTATANPKIRRGFTPWVAGFIRIPYNDIAAISAIANDHPEVVAVLVEPIQGEGGIQIPDADYIAKLRALCDHHQWLLMLDEIQSGMGRTGRWFAHQHAGILPDVMTVAKGLANGVPIGACLAHGPVADIFKPGYHGSTFGGNPLACRAALAVIQTIEREHLLERAHELGQRLYHGFLTELTGIDGIRAIRAQGLLLGIELDKPCGALVTRALEQRLLINVTADRVIRLLPPLILDNDQADEVIATVSRLVRDFTHTA